MLFYLGRPLIITIENFFMNIFILEHSPANVSLAPLKVVYGFVFKNIVSSFEKVFTFTFLTVFLPFDSIHLDHYVHFRTD